MRRNLNALSVFAIVWSAAASAAAAETGTPSEDPCKSRSALSDGKCRQELYRVGPSTVPNSPAFAVLNGTPEQVIRPSTPRQFGAAVLNGVDPNGNFQTGLAVDANPFMIFGGQN